MLERIDGHVRRTTVTELREGTYYAVIELELRGRTLALDARPSDAIAVALRAGAPVLRARVAASNAADQIPDDENALEIDLRRAPERDCPEGSQALARALAPKSHVQLRVAALTRASRALA